MPLSSMTGFSRTSFEAEGAKFSWELKSVNARGLEMRLRLPPGFDHIEADIRTAARERLSRGSCFFTLQKEGGAERARFSLNEDALALVIAAARRLAGEDRIAPATADGLLAIPGVLQERGELLGADAVEARDAAIVVAFAKALATLKQSRLEEGARLKAVLDDQISTVNRLVAEAETISAEAPEILKARIRDQVALLTADRNGLDPDRLHQEAVIAATRADVREEIDRLKSHITGARALIDSNDAVGRRLDFLSQEFNREANTLCSKAFDRRLTAIGMELKAVIDQFREQVQNVE